MLKVTYFNDNASNVFFLLTEEMTMYFFLFLHFVNTQLKKIVEQS